MVLTQAERSRRYRKRHKGKLRVAQAEYRDANREKIRAEWRAWYHRRSRTPECGTDAPIANDEALT